MITIIIISKAVVLLYNIIYILFVLDWYINMNDLRKVYEADRA